MDISFATCDVKKALGFINVMYPNKNITEDRLPKLLALIKKDALRVEDPAMHNPARIIESRNIKEVSLQDIEEAITELRRIIE